MSILDSGDIIYMPAAATILKPLDAAFHCSLGFITGDGYITHIWALRFITGDGSRTHHCSISFINGDGSRTHNC